MQIIYAECNEMWVPTCLESIYNLYIYVDMDNFV